MATGYAPKRILEMANGRGKYERQMREAVSRIAAYTLERALLGDIGHQAALAALAELNGTPSEADKGLEVVMDESAARWAE